MKPTMLFAIVLITAIILASSFGLHIMPIDSIYKLSDDVAAGALYVCPAGGTGWDSIAASMRMGSRYILIGFFFCAMILMFNWGWALYQNLLKDSFKQDAFKNPWEFTKVLFWSAAITMILLATPNHYKTVHINGAAGEWILCESNSVGAVPVHADALRR